MLCLLATLPTGARAFTLWTGPTVTFDKASFADWTLADNQDRMTGNVWITRAETEGLFNIAPGKEIAYDRTQFTSPRDTEWAPGTMGQGIENLNFTNWRAAVGSPPQSIGKDYVLHLISDDIYIDVQFSSWSASGGGGFSYVRSTPVPVPAAIWLFASGFGTWWVLSRRRSL
jgi:hypothetical protein